MDAVYYSAPKNFEIRRLPIPQINDDEVLFKVTCCGVCGTDSHIHEGGFVTKFPLVPGHEVVGVIEEVGKNVQGFSKGERCVADPIISCGGCFHCRRGSPILCKGIAGKGVTCNGGFAEYCVFAANKVHKIHNLTDEEATLVEPTACAIHGMDKLKPGAGIDALIIGSGPTGLILAQLLKLNGAARVVIAANKGIKTQVARDLGAGDEYVELDRENPEAQWEKLKQDNPYGFDVVVEATGVATIVTKAIDYVRRGGTLMIYGVYDHNALVHWSPSKIFLDEIRIIGSFAQAHCFPRAVAYLDSGKIKVKGMVTDVFALGDYQKALDKMKNRQAVKIAIKPRV